MKRFQIVRKGFTLIEMLVTVIVVGVLAAVIIPAVTQQATAGDSARVVADLDFLRTGIENFSVNVRPKFPGDLEDLTNSLSTTADKSLDGAFYETADATRWKGPYVEKTSDIAGVATGNFAPSGYSSFISQTLSICNTATFAGCTSSGGEQFVTLTVSPLSPAQFELINAIVDGGSETASTISSTFSLATGATTGRMRFLLHSPGGLTLSSTLPSNVSGTAYYLAVPYKAP